jgi:hypothetical protein
MTGMHPKWSDSIKAGFDKVKLFRKMRQNFESLKELA